SLEDIPQTQDGIERLALTLFSHYLDRRFDDVSEVLDFARRSSSDFLRAVEQNSLFVAMGGSEKDSIEAAIRRQRDELALWRSAEFMEAVSHATDSELVVMSILERLGPQFHLRENAESFSASPLFSVQAQWHYFRLMSRAS